LNGKAKAEFAEFAHSRWPSLVRLGYGLTGDRGLAEDLAQTALVNAYASWPRVRKADDPDAYVRRILLNCFRSGDARLLGRQRQEPDGSGPGQAQGQR
jgi:DNA-directed RNA polymerase specialized sigma24 family protein